MNYTVTHAASVNWRKRFETLPEAIECAKASALDWFHNTGRNVEHKVFYRDGQQVFSTKEQTQ